MFSRFLSVTARETALDVEVSRVSVEWRSKVSPLKEWISFVVKTVDEGVEMKDMDSLKKKRDEIQVWDDSPI